MSPINEDNFSNEFRKRFQDFEDIAVAEYNWKAIEAAIPKRPSFFNRHWRKTSFLLLLLMSTCLYRAKWVDTFNDSNNLVSDVSQSLIAPKKTFDAIEKKAGSVAEKPLSRSGVQVKNTSNDEFSEVEKFYKLSTFNEIKAFKKGKLDEEIKHNSAFFTSLTGEKRNTVLSLKNTLVGNDGKISSVKNEVVGITQKDTSASKISVVINLENETIDDAKIPVLNETETLPIAQVETQLKKTELLPFLPLLDANKIRYSEKEILHKTENILTNSRVMNLRKRAFYFSVAPQYSYFNFSPKTDDKLLLSNFELLNSLSTKRLSFNIETGITFRINEHFQLNMGLNARNIVKNIAYRAQKETPDSFRIQKINSLKIRLESVKGINKLQEQNTYYLVGINSGLQYSNGSYFVAGGFGLNHLLNASKKTVLNLDFSFGFKQKINNQYDLSIAPQMTYFIKNNRFSSPVLEANPYTIGLKLAVSVR
jgi:hypothetical protein